MSHTSSFDITTPREFLETIVLPQYQDFLSNIASPRYALLAIIVTYHMYEWAHGANKFTEDHFKKTYPDDVGLAQNFELARHITNGTKHCLPKAQTRVETKSFASFIQGFSITAWKEGSWARPLNVQFPNGEERAVDYLLSEMVEFWKSQAKAGAF